MPVVGQDRWLQIYNGKISVSLWISEFEILTPLAMLFVSAKNRQNSMHVTHRAPRNQHSLGRIVHQNTIHLKKLE